MEQEDGIPSFDIVKGDLPITLDPRLSSNSMKQEAGKASPDTVKGDPPRAPTASPTSTTTTKGTVNQ
jgi:hypothetical protein